MLAHIRFLEERREIKILIMDWMFELIQMKIHLKILMNKDPI